MAGSLPLAPPLSSPSPWSSSVFSHLKPHLFSSAVSACVCPCESVFLSVSACLWVSVTALTCESVRVCVSTSVSASVSVCACVSLRVCVSVCVCVCVCVHRERSGEWCCTINECTPRGLVRLVCKKRFKPPPPWEREGKRERERERERTRKNNKRIITNEELQLVYQEREGQDTYEHTHLVLENTKRDMSLESGRVRGWKSGSERQMVGEWEDEILWDPKSESGIQWSTVSRKKKKTHVRRSAHAHKHTSIHVYPRQHARAHNRRVSLYVSLFIYIYIYMCVYINICIYV